MTEGRHRFAGILCPEGPSPASLKIVVSPVRFRPSPFCEALQIGLFSRATRLTSADAARPVTLASLVLIGRRGLDRRRVRATVACIAKRPGGAAAPRPGIGGDASSRVLTRSAISTRWPMFRRSPEVTVAACASPTPWCLRRSKPARPGSHERRLHPTADHQARRGARHHPRHRRSAGRGRRSRPQAASDRPWALSARGGCARDAR